MKLVLEVLWLTAVIVVCGGFTLGLTWVPCYSALCSEDKFPLETRVHVGIYYALLATTAVALLLRAYMPALEQLSNKHLTKRDLPIFGKRMSVGGLALAIWLLAVILATTGFWVGPEVQYWAARMRIVRWTEGTGELIATTIIGHHVDMILGLVIIPVSRNSVLGRVFKVHQSTLLDAHKLLAYLLFVGVIAHWLAYMVFIARYNAEPTGQENFNINQPQFTQAEAASMNSYYLSVLGSGLAAFGFMIIIVVTSLPALRRNAYNTFYFAHIVCSVAIWVLACIHASTDFYFLLPGLILWVVDWAWRLFAGGFGLSKTVSGTLEDAGNGWYRISLPVDAKLPHNEKDVEAAAGKHKIPTHPVQSYYLNFPGISRLQNHPFTAASVGSTRQGPTFLFQRAIGKKSQKSLNKEWTWRVGALTDSRTNLLKQESASKSALTLPTRVEGPYIPGVPEMMTSNHIICIVGGTGVTGALSIAEWWISNRSGVNDGISAPGSGSPRLSLIWTVRHVETADLREWHELITLSKRIEGLELDLRVSSTDGRLDCEQYLRSKLTSSSNQVEHVGTCRSWVYVSGPEGLLKSAETACLQLRREDAPARRLDYYVAQWEV